MASAILFTFVLLPIIYSVVLYKLDGTLGEEKNVKTIGTLYLGRRVDNGSNVWLYPLFFFLRRTAFVAVTIYLFAFPSLQMLSHQLLTLGMLLYLCWDDQMFETTSQKIVEIGSEYLMLGTCVFLAQFQYIDNDEY